MKWDEDKESRGDGKQKCHKDMQSQSKQRVAQRNAAVKENKKEEINSCAEKGNFMDD